MITLLLALATIQDTTIVIHPDSSSATLEARALPKVVSDEVIRFYNDPGTTRLVGRTRLPRGNEWRGNVAIRNGRRQCRWSSRARSHPGCPGGNRRIAWARSLTV